MKFLNKNWLGILIFSILIIFVFFARIREKETLDYLENGKVLFTICEISNYEKPAKGSSSFSFFYYYNNTKIDSWSGFRYELNKLNSTQLKSYVGKKYFVKFSIEKPEYSEIYLDKPVPEDFVYKEGQTWSKIPID